MANFPQVVHELKRQRDQIDQAIAALTMLSNDCSTRGISPTSTSSVRGKRHMSASARARIAAAQRARWAKLKAGSTSAPKRTMSASARRRIAAAQRARWAKLRSGKK